MRGNTHFRFGELLADWPVLRLRAVVRQRREWTEIDDEREYVRVTARVRNQGVEHRDRVVGAKIKIKRQQIVRANDLLVAEIDAKVGGIGIVHPDLDGAIVSSHYYLFEIVQNGLTLAWLDQWVRAGKLQRQVDAIGSTNYAAVRPADVLAFQVAVPPLPEQRAIAEILGSVDDAIRRTEACIDQLRTTKHQVMRELLTVGHPDFRTRLIRLKKPWRIGRVAPDVEKAPKHWEFVTLTKVARLESGHTPSRKHPEYWGGNIPWISLQDTDRLQQLVISQTTETIGELGLKNSSARLLPKDTVVFSRTASVGLCALMGRRMATSQDFANWVCGERLNPRYLVQVFRHMGREWTRLQAGSTHQTVYMPVFKRLKILLPSLDEQRAIADVGESFDLRLAAVQRAPEQLSEVKRGLAQALLTGRVRVQDSTQHNKPRGLSRGRPRSSAHLKQKE